MTVDPSRVHGILLLLGDGPEDVPAARHAAALAAGAGTRVLAAAVLPATARSGDDQLVKLVRRRDEARAVGGRVRPTFDASDVPLTVVPLLAPSGVVRTPKRLRKALRLLIGRSGACLVVVPDRVLLGVPPETVAGWAPSAVVVGGTRQRELL